MNKVILIGRLTRDVEVRRSETTTISRFSLAVDRKFKKEGEQSADFINCVTFGKTAEFAEKYLNKGTKIAIEGRIQTGSYTDKNGQKVYTTDVIIESMEFAESKASSNANANANSNNNDIASQFMDIADDVSDEGLPFN